MVTLTTNQKQQIRTRETLPFLSVSLHVSSLVANMCEKQNDEVASISIVSSYVC